MADRGAHRGLRAQRPTGSRCGRCAGSRRSRRGRPSCSSTGWASMSAATTTLRRQMAAAGIEVHGIRPSRLRRVERSARVRVDAGRSSMTISRHGWATCGRRATASRVVALRPLDGRPDRPRLCRWRTIPRPLPDLVVLTLAGLDSTIARLEAGRGTDPRPDRAAAPDPERLQARRPVARSGGGCAARRRSALPAQLHRPAGRRRLRRAGSRPRACSPAVRRCPCPTYVVHGSDDPIVPVDASEPVAEGRPNVTRRVYPGLRHETHNEPEGAAVVDDTIAWLRAAALSRR